MPVTFLAHQAPVLPIARRWPGTFDGVALVIGSMAPDLAYVLNGSRFEIWAHGFPGLVTFCVPVSVVLAWVVARVVSPVAAPHLPNLGRFHLRDYRGLGVYRVRWLATPVSAFVGALTHVGLDHFTHDWGWFAQHVPWYRTVLVHDLAGRNWTVFLVVQNVGHVVGIALCVWLLARYGSQRWLAASAAQVPELRVTVVSTGMLVVCSAAGVVGGLAWVSTRPVEKATDILRLAAVAFAGLCAGCLAVRLLGHRRAASFQVGGGPGRGPA